MRGSLAWPLGSNRTVRVPRDAHIIHGSSRVELHFSDWRYGLPQITNNDGKTTLLPSRQY